MHYKCLHFVGVADGDGGWGVRHLTFQARILFVAVYRLLSMYVVVFQLGLLYIILVPFFLWLLYLRKCQRTSCQTAKIKKQRRNKQRKKCGGVSKTEQYLQNHICMMFYICRLYILSS